MSEIPSNYKFIAKKNEVMAQKFTAVDYHPKHMHMHDHYELLLIAGEQECRIVNNGNEQIVKPPALVIHRPFTYHLTDMIGPGEYISYIVFFTPQSIGKIPDDVVVINKIAKADCTVISLDESANKSFQHYIKLLRYTAVKKNRVLLACALLNEIYNYSDARNTVFMSSINYNYIVDIIHEITENFGSDIKTDELARNAHVSVSKLNGDFRKMTGTTIKNFVTDYRVKRAAELLLSDNVKTTDVAYICGFCNDSHFIQCFKKQTGMTPGKYVKQIKSEE